MSLGPDLYPVNIDADDGSINLLRVKLFLTYDETTRSAVRVRAYSGVDRLVLDEPVASLAEGNAPMLVSGRHQIVLEDGRTLYVQSAGGCGCGNRLKSWRPGIPATSGFRP